MMKSVKFGDFIILFLIIAAIFVSFRRISQQKKGAMVHISTSTETYEYPLSKDGIFDIPGDLGITKVEIKDEKVRIIDSPCPNKTCIQMGWGNLLICMPNQVVVSVPKSGDYDAIAE